MSSAEQLGVSQMTIRRDLVELERLGLVRVVRGGAKPATARPFSTRNALFDTQKWEVAKKIAPLVPKSGIIAIDSSSTMARLCRILNDAKDLTVVTNSLISFQTLQGRRGIVPLLTGGVFDPRSDSLVGWNCESFISAFAFDMYFASTASFIPQRGGFESTMEEAAVKTAFIRASSKVVLGVSAEKLHERAPFASFTNTNIDILCSNQETSFWDDKGLPTDVKIR